MYRTVAMPTDEFRRLARPTEDFIGPHEPAAGDRPEAPIPDDG
jgi:hypothetical protein